MITLEISQLKEKINGCSWLKIIHACCVCVIYTGVTQ